MSRATAYLESAIGGLDARRDRVPLGLLHERLGHISGAPPGIPRGRCARRDGRSSSSRANRAPNGPRSLATLAQLKMLDGIFSEAQRLARDAIKVARACDPVARSQEVHATTTLAVALAWGKDPGRPIELLREAETAARGAGRSGRALPDPGQPDDGPRPRRPPRRRRSRSPTRGSRTRGAPASRPSTATSWRATWPTRSSCSAAGPRRVPSPNAR